MEEKGLALMSVLWVVLILSIMALGLLSSTLVQTRLTHNVRSQVEAENIADAGIYLAIQRLNQPQAAAIASKPGNTFIAQFAGQDIEVRIEQERGKVDLNYAHQNVIENLLLYHKMHPEQALMVAQKYSENYSSDKKKVLLSVSEFSQYSQQIVAIYDCIYPYITVYSGISEVDWNSASKEVLLFLSWADEKKNGNKAGVGSAPVTPSTSVLRTATSSAGWAFRIHASIKLDQNWIVTRSAVVRLSGDGQQPYWVHEWQTDYSNAEVKCPMVDAS